MGMEPLAQGTHGDQAAGGGEEGRRGKKKAEVRTRAAYRRKQRKFEENGLLEGFVQINWSFMAARDELKRRGFSLELMNKLKADVGGARGSDMVATVDYHSSGGYENLRGANPVGGVETVAMPQEAWGTDPIGGVEMVE